MSNRPRARRTRRLGDSGETFPRMEPATEWPLPDDPHDMHNHEPALGDMILAAVAEVGGTVDTERDGVIVVHATEWIAARAQQLAFDRLGIGYTLVDQRSYFEALDDAGLEDLVSDGDALLEWRPF